jgi:hypothetical protein
MRGNFYPRLNDQTGFCHNFMDERELRELYHRLNEFIGLDNQGGNEATCIRRKVHFVEQYPEVLSVTADMVMGYFIEGAVDERSRVYLKDQRKFLQGQAKFSLLEAYIQEGDVERKKKMLFTYPELFGEEICGMLERLIRMQKDPNAAAAWTRELEILLKVREKSLDFPTLSFKRH